MPPDLPRDWFSRCRLKFRHLELLAALDASRHLGRAAAATGMPQPAASKLLGELEERLGHALFERQPRGLQPTAHGEVLIRRAHMILGDLEGAREELTGLARGDAGRVAVGTVDAPAVTLVLDVVEAMQRRHPRMQIHLTTAPSDVLTAGLLDGTLDLALGRPVGEAARGAILYEEIGTERLCFVARSGHELAARPSVPLEALAAAPWILQPQSSLSRRSVDRLFHGHGLAPPGCVVNTRSLLLTLTYVSRTDAISVVSEPVARLHAALGQVAILPVPHEVVVGPYGLLLPRGRLLSPAAQTMLAALREAVEGQGSAP